MNKAEQIVYNVLKKNAYAKLFVRNVYQSIFDLIPVKKCISKYKITAREGHFFGFHDKSPYSADNQFLLSNKYHTNLKMPTKDDYLTLGVFKGNNHEDFIPLTKTYAWNWHQGCMLQWKGKEHSFVFNDADKNTLVTKVFNMENETIQTIPAPIGAVSPDGKHAVGYNFSRVFRYMTGYGYMQGVDPEIKLKQPNNTGLYYVNLDSGQVNHLFSIKEIASITPESSMKDSYHYFSHCLFSPSSQRFVFMHRWVKSAEKQNQRWSRLISCDINGDNIYIFPTTEMVSHIAWKNESQILAYSRMPKLGDKYFLFRDQSPMDFEIIGESAFNSDGHPSFSPNKKWIVTDTYPNRTRQQYLILYNLQNQQRINIAKLKHPKKYTSLSHTKHWSCDLHPRWDRAGRYLSFDSVYTGVRALCSIDLNNINFNH